MSKKPFPFKIPPFEDIKISTATIMAYANVEFNLERLFPNICLTAVDVPLTKKVKKVDKKRLSAPYGAIVSVQTQKYFRGVDTRQIKKRWCATTCQLKKIIHRTDGFVTERKINTVIAEAWPIEHTDVYQYRYWCTNCKKYYTLKQLRVIPNFLNQVTVILALSDVNPNIMIFKDSIKIVGCKSTDDAIEAVMLLWENYITHIPNSWKYIESPAPITPTLSPHFVFEQVMKNGKFNFDFSIDRINLTRLMNQKQYKQDVKMAVYENTNQTCVKTKMYVRKPKNFTYKCLAFPNNKKPRILSVNINPYEKEKSNKEKLNTFIVFSSSQTILSGRHDLDMKRVYEFFTQEVIKNRKFVEETIDEKEAGLDISNVSNEMSTLSAM